MPIEKLQGFETDHLNAGLYKTELNKHNGDIPLASPGDTSKIVLGTVGGFAIGFLLCMLTKCGSN